MVGVQLEGEDGVQHSFFCIQINDIDSSGKSGPLATLVGLTNVQHADMSTVYGKKSCTSLLFSTGTTTCAVTGE